MQEVARLSIFQPEKSSSDSGEIRSFQAYAKS